MIGILRIMFNFLILNVNKNPLNFLVYNKIFFNLKNFYHELGACVGMEFDDWYHLKGGP